MDPAEEAMRKQMFLTLGALEKMATAVTAHLTADKQPAEQCEPEAVDDSLRTLRMKVAGGGACDHERIQTQCSVCAKWLSPASEPPKAPTDDELKKIGKVVAKHHQALGLVATFAEMKSNPALGTQPARAIALLLGMKACDECVGTGWLARDETCAKCGRTGYLKA